MGQKVNPISFRLGVINTWSSVWYEDKKSYAKNFHEDLKIRKFVKEKYSAAGISKVKIERFPDRVNINISTARPGILIGRKGADIEVMKKEIQKFASRKVNININEEKKVEQNATLVAEQIASQLKARLPFRRAVKQAITSAMRGGALGIKVAVSGRLNGAEMSRFESYSEGRTPLHTLRANIDYGFAEALTTFGLIGVKVWVYNGDVLSGKETEEDEYSVKRRKN